MSGGRKFNAGREHATRQSIDSIIEYLQRLKYGGHLRAIAVAYVDADGRDYSLLAVQHLDQVGAAAVGRGLVQLASTLAADSIGDLKP